MFSSQLHVPSYGRRAPEEVHALLLGEAARRLQEASLPVPAPEPQGLLPGGGDGFAAVRKQDHRQQEQDGRAGKSDSAGGCEGQSTCSGKPDLIGIISPCTC